MRNLKRALSLALASVMVIGMMVVGTGASYADVEATDNVEAIEVLQAVGIMTGDENGDFNPDANVTRNEIAVIMSNLLNLDYDYYRGVNPFTDVPSWAAPYVAACYAEGVTAGAGNGLYNGAGNVTAAEAALMIMKALGYFQYQADFGTDWKTATVRQASYINLFDGINATAEAALTRNQIAQLVLNGLKANMVTFTGTVGATIGDVNFGYVAEYTPITNASSKYNRIDVGTTNIASDDKYYVQLGEELYNGDLQLRDDVDVFGRPARYWEYDGKEIGTYLNDTLMVQEYTVKVTGDMLYELLTRNTVNDYELTVVIDGMYADEAPDAIAGRWFSKNSINRNNDSGLGGTGNGVLTQVFVDNDEDTITVAIINTYLALANKDYDAKKDEIGFDVYGLASNGVDYYKLLNTPGDDQQALKVTGEDFDIENLVEGDAVLVNVADGEIQVISDCEMIAGTVVDAFETGSNDGSQSAPSALEIDGTEYKFADAAEFDCEVMEYYTGRNGVTNLKDLTYNVYLDAYGYVIGVEEVEKVNNYLFITGIDLNGSNLGARTATANAIFLDGTMATIDVNMTKSEFQTATNPGGTDGNPLMNAWFTYTVNSSKVYTVTEVSNVTINAPEVDYVPGGAENDSKLAQYQMIVDNADDSAMEIDDRHISVDGTTNAGTGYDKVYGTDETVYLTVSLDALGNNAIIDEVESVVVGIGNANLEVWDTDVVVAESNLATTGAYAEGVYSLYNNDGDMIAAIVVGEDAGASKNLVYVHSASIYREKYDSTTDTYTWSRKVISNGQEVILTEVGEGVGDLEKMDQYEWYQVKFNAEGNVIEAIPVQETLQGDELIDDYDDIADAVDAEDTVLYYGVAPEINTDDLKLVGKTLWLDGTATKGFRVAEDVNIVLIQWNNNDKKTYFESGVTSLKNVVNDLNERHDGMIHSYQLSAILEKGVATSIVIYDYNPNCDPYTDGDWDDDKTGDLDLTALVFNGAAGMDITFTNNSGAAFDGTEVADVVVRNASGNRVYAVNDANVVNPVADGGFDTITFGYTGNPTNTGDYTVQLTIKSADGETVLATGTATLGTV